MGNWHVDHNFTVWCNKHRKIVFNSFQAWSLECKALKVDSLNKFFQIFVEKCRLLWYFPLNFELLRSKSKTNKRKQSSFLLQKFICCLFLSEKVSKILSFTHKSEVFRVTSADYRAEDVHISCFIPTMSLTSFFHFHPRKDLCEKTSWKKTLLCC